MKHIKQTYREMILAIIILIIGLIYTYFREGNVKVRYICLFCGTMILGFMAIKGFSNFILVAFFPLAYFFKDMVPKDLRNLFLPVQKIINIIFISFACLVIIGFGYVYISNKNTITLKHNAQGAIDTLLKYTDKVFPIPRNSISAVYHSPTSLRMWCFSASCAHP